MEYLLSFFNLTTADVKAWFLSILPNLFGALITIILFVIVYSLIARVVDNSLKKTAIAPSLREIIVHSFLKWAVGVVALTMVLNQLGIDVTAAIAGVGIAGIALGFAAKETLSNMLAGLSIFIDKLYTTGDWIEVVGKYGQVKAISLRTTKIRTLDNIFIIIPNNQVTTAPVTNFSEDGEVRITAKIGISYDSSIEKARSVILEAIKTIEGVRTSPEPRVVVDELGDSSVNLLVRMWVDDPGTDPSYRFELTEKCKLALDEAGIEIPFPQRVVHTRKDS